METIFARTFGQDSSKQKIAQTFSNDLFSSVTLIYGARGLGQNAMALDLAEQVICESPDTKPCKTCEACLGFKNQNNHAVRFIFPLAEIHQKKKDVRLAETAAKTADVLKNPYGYSAAGNEHISVAQIRDLKESQNFSQAKGSSQVILIFYPEKMGPASANSLLKILEEPRTGTYFILACEDKASLLPTILSRCVNLRLAPLEEDELHRFAGQYPDWEKSTKDQWLSLCRNSPGLLLELVESASENLFEVTLEFLKVTLEKNWNSFSNWMDSGKFFADAEESVHVLKLALEMFRYLFKEQVSTASLMSLQSLAGSVEALANPKEYVKFLEQTLRATEQHCRPANAVIGNFLKFELS